jgi:hypothetical protein
LFRIFDSFRNLMVTYICNDSPAQPGTQRAFFDDGGHGHKTPYPPPQTAKVLPESKLVRPNYDILQEGLNKVRPASKLVRLYYDIPAGRAEQLQKF